MLVGEAGRAFGEYRLDRLEAPIREQGSGARQRRAIGEV